MAAHRILTLNIGSQQVSLAEFRTGSKGTLALTALETRELVADPAADASRLAQATLAFGELAEALRIKGEPVHCTLPAHAVFSRLVKLPLVEPAKLAQTVGFEAQQNIPYPLSEVVWDYKCLSEPSAAEPEVLIVAAKTDLLEDWTGATEKAGMTPASFELAPLSLYNAFRYNYGEPVGCSLLVDLGSRTTNLVFIEPGKFFLRVISSGGTALTTLVSKEFSEPFSAAEQRKREKGFVGNALNQIESADGEIAKLSKVLRNGLTRLHAEIARSVSFYRSQQGGSVPTQVYLCGGGASLGMVEEFLAEKLSIPVELFNPLRCIQSNKDFPAPTLAKIAPTLGEHVGLALRSAWACPFASNLLPISIQQKSVRSQRVAAVAFTTLCLSAPLLAWGHHFNHAAALASAEVRRQSPQVDKLSRIQKELASTRREIDSLIERAAPLQGAVRDRQYWTMLIDHLHSKLPEEKVWITSFEISSAETAAKPGLAVKPRESKAAATSPASKVKAEPTTKPDPRQRLLLKGLYLENPRGIALVEQFGKALQNSDYFDVAPEQEWVRTNVLNPTEWAQEFAIPLYLKNPPAASSNPSAHTP
ncbi:MAG: type pilus assembly protein PilM [Verrucomicrobiota bacterium]|jgi:type IV pilus assembly protein PilM